MFCEFQIFSLYGTGGMGLRRRKMIKTSKKLFSMDPQKHIEVFCLHFLRFRYGWILYAERMFCRVLFSRHRSLNKTTVLQQDCFFFPAQHHKYAFKTTKDGSSKNLAYNALRVDVASAVREVSQKSQWKANIFAPGSINCGTTFCKFAYRLYLVNVHCLCTS